MSVGTGLVAAVDIGSTTGAVGASVGSPLAPPVFSSDAEEEHEQSKSSKNNPQTDFRLIYPPPDISSESCVWMLQANNAHYTIKTKRSATLRIPATL